MIPKSNLRLMQPSGKPEDVFLYRNLYKFYLQLLCTMLVPILLIMLSSPKIQHPLIGEVLLPYILFLPSILALHLYTSRLFFGHLSYTSSAEGGRRGCLAINLLFRCHLLINEADKVVAMHSMRRW